jgi:hypothetical protein
MGSRLMIAQETGVSVMALAIVPDGNSGFDYA